MENTTKPPENKKMPCICTALVGAFVIAFAWWKVSWGAIALTILGVIIILKGLINQCCCTCQPFKKSN